MLFFKLSIFSILLLVSGINAMEGRLPADIIREIARLSLQSNWHDIDKRFLLQSMENVNTQWRVAVSLLPRDHFPYQ